MLWVVLLALVGLAVQVRNGFGALVVLVALAGAFAVDWWAPPRVVALVACAVAWFLLLAAPRTVVELATARARRSAGTSDPDQLAALTGVPALLWVAGFALVSLAALALGGAWVLGAGWWPPG